VHIRRRLLKMPCKSVITQLVYFESDAAIMRGSWGWSRVCNNPPWSHLTASLCTQQTVLCACSSPCATRVLFKPRSWPPEAAHVTPYMVCPTLLSLCSGPSSEAKCCYTQTNYLLSRQDIDRV
jgi:hypothetical protein